MVIAGTEDWSAGVAVAEGGTLDALTVLMWNVPYHQLLQHTGRISLHWGRPDDSTVTEADNPSRTRAPWIRAWG
jgi:hypothetical protein